LDETLKHFQKFNTTWRSLLIQFNYQREDSDPEVFLRECITALTNYLADEAPDRDLVGLKIRNTVNV
jgi:hypothetical protein